MWNSYLSCCCNCILTHSTYYDGNPTICCYQGFNLAVELLPWKQSLRTNKDLLTLIACLSLNVVLSSTKLFNHQQALLLTLKSKCNIWLNKYWELYYEISLFINVKSYYLHVIIQMKSFLILAV